MAIRELHLKRSLLCILIVSTILVVGGSRDGSVASALQPQMPGTDAEQLWKYITKDNPYKSWKNLPNTAEQPVGGSSAERYKGGRRDQHAF